MTKTGLEIVTQALKNLEVIDPVDPPHAEQVAYALFQADLLLDQWRIQGLTIGGVTRNVFNLATDTQSYTLGSGGAFNQPWVPQILRWSVIPDDDAAEPLEEPGWVPLTFSEWQGISNKTRTAARPHAMYYDGRYAAGLGNCLFYPVPDNADVDVAIYSRVPALTGLAQGTSYDLAPGVMKALIDNLAVNLPGFARQPSQKLVMDAAESLGLLKRSHIIPVEAPIRKEYLIGGRERSFNVYEGR